MNPSPRANPLKRQALAFAVLSAVSFVGYLGLTALFHEVLNISTWLSVPIAMTCMTLFNFVTLRLFIFDNHAGRWTVQLAGFLASIVGFRAAEYACFLLLSGVLSIPYLPAYAGILLVSAVCKFVFLRQVLFAQKTTSPVLAETTP